MSHYNEQFLKQNPLAILGVLRDLSRGQVPLRVSWSGGQFISKILEITQDRLVMDFGSQDNANLAAQHATEITITAETQGAKVEFTLEQLQRCEFLQLPAFTTPLPQSLWFIQRREYFRICAPLQPDYYCSAKLPDNSTLRFRLVDLSLGGMGALMEEAKPGELEEGMDFSQVELNMGQWGIFHVDAQLISISERKAIDGKNETITTPRLSFRFLNVGPAVERELQRIIFSLEREAREKANKVRH
ncbi:flagellar brake protein [Citrobacter amalonaticus]|uniref:Flagellar brake protein YcgR n=1 Tax=Citrobacter amalonaticus TaxID=35703 RepID=A0A2S4S1U2_CITAM|nr:flagellar brake protein [Citrobacter amalonaticus]POT59264.1 flagellar brake protein [Citrobacter amalonaticus]POT77394.1 flagellar brake protein [Citrobacter amalonaticus]POU67846.1 flagellar brake protein [Citrobacter amalonaticus]POV07450.1 flagellar brake protein [Citrobacter amalonaticus]